MASIISKSETIINTDENGNVTESKKESTSKIEKSTEPDYIKLYTRMWCEFNEIPDAYRNLFLELVIRMSYSNKNDLVNSQTVYVGEPICSSIMKNLNWKRAMFQKGLKALCDCKAIKKVARGLYQISPKYAGRGEWKYNPQLQRGGIEDLIATFNFKTGEVDTKVVWADDGQDNDLNNAYRQALGVNKGENTVLSSKKITPIREEA